MKIEDLIKDENQERALTKAIAAITIMKEALETVTKPYSPSNCIMDVLHKVSISTVALEEVEKL